MPATAIPLRSSRFEVVRTLGRGGFGVVYEAIDRTTAARVALKTIPDFDPAALFRFKREFRALSDVSHPNLVHLRELVCDAGAWFFTMELVDGVDFVAHVCDRDSSEDGPALASTIAADTVPRSRERATPMPARVGGRFHEARLRTAFAQLVDGVSALHAAGTLHRDLKPSNVLVNREGRVVILDFGLAWDLRFVDGGLTEVGQLTGTPAYMAPEQVTGIKLTEAADWYAVGVILFEALSGTLPFDGGALEIMVNKQHTEAPRLRDLVSHVPPDLEECVARLLERDPSCRPSAADLRAVRPRTGKVISIRPRASHSTRLIGRDEELRELGDSFATALLGRSSVVCLRGLSGMGKTALVRGFLEGVEEGKAALVLAGRCYERETLPYKAFDAVMDGVTRSLLRLPRAEADELLPTDAALIGRLFPVLLRVPSVADAPSPVAFPLDPERLRTRAFAALRELFTRFCSRGPVVVVIDDLQWGDADSAALLHDLTTSRDAPALCVVLVWREESVTSSPSLQLLLRPGSPLGLPSGRREIAVGPLRTSDASELVRRLLPGRESEVTGEMLQEAGGSPFLLNELVRYAGSRVQGGANVVRLDVVLRERVRELREPALRLLFAVALSARPFPLRVTTEAAGLPPEEGERAADSLRVGHLVRSAGSLGTCLEPYHDRIRDAVIALASASQQREIHESLVKALSASGEGDPEVLLHHARAAGLGHEAGVHARDAAGRATAALAFDRAAELYREAIELLGPEDRALLTRALADALTNAGRGPEAAAAYRSAAALDTTNGLDLPWRAAAALLRAGHHDEGLRAMSEVLTAARLPLPRSPLGFLLSLVLARLWLAISGRWQRPRAASPDELARVDLCWSAAVGLAGDPLPAGLLQTRHLAIASKCDDPYRAARALAMEILFLASQGAGEARIEATIVRARTLATQSGNPHAIGLVTGMTGMARYLAGAFEVALGLFDEAEGILRDQCIGVAWELDMMRLFALECLAYLGRLDELSARIPPLVAEAERRGDRFAATMLRTGIQNMAWLAEDDPDGGRRAVTRAEELWSPHGFHVQHFLHLFAHVQLDLYGGDGIRALARLDAVGRRMTRSFVLGIPFVKACAHHLRARALLSAAAHAPRQSADRVRWLRAARVEGRKLRAMRLGWASACGHAVFAGIEFLENRPDAARSLLEAAASCDEIGLSLHALALRRSAGEAMGGKEGALQISSSDRAMRARGVSHPRRMAAMLTGVRGGRG